MFIWWGTKRASHSYPELWECRSELPVCAGSPWWPAHSPVCRWGHGCVWFPAEQPGSAFLMLLSFLPYLLSTDVATQWKIVIKPLETQVRKYFAFPKCYQNSHLPMFWSHLSLLPLLLDWQLLITTQLSTGIGKLHLQLGHAGVERGGLLTTLRQLLIGPVKQFLKLRHPTSVIVSIYGAIGQSLWR